MCYLSLSQRSSTKKFIVVQHFFLNKVSTFFGTGYINSRKWKAYSSKTYSSLGCEDTELFWRHKRISSQLKIVKFILQTNERRFDLFQIKRQDSGLSKNMRNWKARKLPFKLPLRRKHCMVLDTLEKTKSNLA